MERIILSLVETFVKLMMCVHKVRAHLSLLGILLSGFVCAQGKANIDQISLVSDIDASLPAAVGHVYGSDAHIFHVDPDSQLATVSLDLGPLFQAGIDAFHNSGDGCGDALYSVDNTAMIAGVAMRPADVFTSAGVKVLNADSEDIPAGVNITAVSREIGTCDLIISTDVEAQLNGSFFKSDDLIRWSATKGFTLYQATGLNANVDAIHLLSDNRLLLSLDTTILLGNCQVNDESVIEFRDNNYQLIAFDPSESDGSWFNADLVAIWVSETSNDDIIFINGFEGCG